MPTDLLADDDITRLIAAWRRYLQSVRRLAPKTLEAYTRDLGEFTLERADTSFACVKTKDTAQGVVTEFKLAVFEPVCLHLLRD